VPNTLRLFGSAPGQSAHRENGWVRVRQTPAPTLPTGPAGMPGLFLCTRSRAAAVELVPRRTRGRGSTPTGRPAPRISGAGRWPLWGRPAEQLRRAEAPVPCEGERLAGRHAGERSSALEPHSPGRCGERDPVNVSPDGRRRGGWHHPGAWLPRSTLRLTAGRVSTPSRDRSPSVTNAPTAAGRTRNATASPRAALTDC
jgi:hypothetical protein